jgi:hypothetical protein
MNEGIRVIKWRDKEFNARWSVGEGRRNKGGEGVWGKGGYGRRDFGGEL